MAEATPLVLVADAEGFFREAIVDLLGEAGLACDAVASGGEVMERIHDPAIGAVVLDVALREPAAVDVLRRIRERRPTVRVIAVSAEPDHEIVLQALREGATDYLAKPLHGEELVLAVRRALAGFDVEARWGRLRQRLRGAEAAATRLAAWEDDATQAALDGFGAALVGAVAELLDAEKTSLMLYDAVSGELSVAAVTGTELDPGAMDPVALGEGVAGVALSLGEALLVEDIYGDGRFPGRTPRERYATASLAVVPLRRANQALGVLCATDRVGGVPFSDDELSLLQILALPAIQFLGARAAAPAPDATPPAAAVSPLAGEIARGVCEALVREIEPAAVLEGALRAASASLSDAGVALHLIDNRSGKLLREHELAGVGPPDRNHMPRDRGLTGRVLQGGAPLASDCPERDDAFDPDVDTADDGEGRPLVCVPLVLRGKVVGVVRAFPETTEGLDAPALHALSTALSAAVRNVLLYRSLLESIDELSEARREAGGSRLA